MGEILEIEIVLNVSTVSRTVLIVNDVFCKNIENIQIFYLNIRIWCQLKK